ncbi:hypothetical protein AtDm6_0808 [Acetobacter tropicalis]|uniref:Uncharacterized protein n=1 Tax=Acetobacter tropicalis TaxID=104102 RepID=A0A094YUL6_9PROT|nr:hypothetical protein AtDm6_0808 [Acetobacter tropicalis]
MANPVWQKGACPQPFRQGGGDNHSSVKTRLKARFRAEKGCTVPVFPHTPPVCSLLGGLSVRGLH